MKHVLQLVVLVFLTTSFAKGQAFIQNTDEIQHIGTAIYFLEDKTNQLTLQEILDVTYQRKFVKHQQRVFFHPSNKNILV